MKPAHAYIALVTISTDATVLGGADYFTTTQLANGSWNDDPYSTALALRAVHFSRNKPVLPLTTILKDLVAFKVTLRYDVSLENIS